MEDTKDREIKLSRVLNAPVALVWEVWTNPEHIKNWWGPTGFTNTISKMDVEPQGIWDLVMHGPDGTDYKNHSVFTEVIKHQKLVYDHVSGPKFTATVTFEEQGNKTLLKWHMLFESKEQFIQVVKTFKADEGLTQNVDKLEVYLKTRIELYKQNREISNETTHKNNKNMGRVTTYLNFPGNTEEAMRFYKEIFNGEFTGVGLRRFGDIEMPEGMPPMDDETKNLIIHAELTIFGNHAIMATDAPESMGFKMVNGNNMHINVEPDSREETLRLFEALSKDGSVTMPMEDMFFGAYFGSCTDKYGINWMFHYSEK